MSPGNNASLSGDFVKALAVGHDGRIWMGTESDGVSVLDPAIERFTRDRHDPAGADGIGPVTIHALAVACAETASLTFPVSGRGNRRSLATVMPALCEALSQRRKRSGEAE